MWELTAGKAFTRIHIFRTCWFVQGQGGSHGAQIYSLSLHVGHDMGRAGKVLLGFLGQLLEILLYKVIAV